MLVRDIKNGQLFAVADNRFAPTGLVGLQRFEGYPHGHLNGLSGVDRFGNYRAVPGQVVYDGLGNPVGVLPFLAALAPLAAKALAFLPKIASSILPMMTGGSASPAGASGQHPVPERGMMPSLTPAPLMPAAAAAAAQGAFAPAPPPDVVPASAPPLTPDREEVVVAPMRMQTPRGVVVVPVRVRRRRRSRRRLARVAPQIFQRSLPPPDAILTPRATDQRNLQGWVGFGGWQGY